jgi:HSP20 family protein
MEDKVMLPIRRTYRPMYMSNFFDNDLDTFFRPTSTFKPAVNVREDEKAYNIELALPGMSKDDIKIEIEKNILMISSEKKDSSEESENGYNLREFGYQSFCRNFTIPENADAEKISASYKDGILNVGIPKSKKETKVNRLIKIS